MDSYGGYVALAYAVVAGVLAAYAVWLVARLRRAERSLPPEPVDAGGTRGEKVAPAPGGRES